MFVVGVVCYEFVVCKSGVECGGMKTVEEEEEEDHLGQILFLLTFLDFLHFGCGGNGVRLLFTYFGFWSSDFEVMIDDSFVSVRDIY